MRSFFIASIVLALAACASNEPAKPMAASAAPAASGVQVASEDKVVCHRVQAIGELTSHTVCEKQSEISLRDQNALQEAARQNQANHMHAVPGSGS
ncbi:MAG TPA: hypothetical protein VIP05_24915 [Burkholderiaceae bacterium]